LILTLVTDHRRYTVLVFNQPPGPTQPGHSRACCHM